MVDNRICNIKEILEDKIGLKITLEVDKAFNNDGMEYTFKIPKYKFRSSHENWHIISIYPIQNKNNPYRYNCTILNANPYNNTQNFYTIDEAIDELLKIINKTSIYLPIENKNDFFALRDSKLYFVCDDDDLFFTDNKYDFKILDKDKAANYLNNVEDNFLSKKVIEDIKNMEDI